MWYVYIIYSKKIDKYYTGYTNNIELRMVRHNDGWGRYTKEGVPWRLVYNEEYSIKSEAIKREREIKKKKSGKLIEAMIYHAGGRPD